MIINKYLNYDENEWKWLKIEKERRKKNWNR